MQAANNELAKLAQQGDQAALFALWTCVNRLLYLKAREFYWHYGTGFCAAHGVTLEDLEQTSYFAFLDAVRAYNPAKGYNFVTYLTFASKNRFKAAVGLNKAHPFPLDIADSLNRPALDEDDGEVGELLPDAQAEEAIASVDERDLQNCVHALLESAMLDLTPTQAQVMQCRFMHQLTRRQTAEKLQITQDKVRTEEERAMRTLRGSRPVHQIMALWR